MHHKNSYSSLQILWLSWTLQLLLTHRISPTAFAGFSRPEYIFAEEDGTGSVMVEGTPGVNVTVRGGRLVIGFSMWK